ncbi:MAG: hypothetical protein A2041_06135 [Bacteroidetes bacterium GWA2_31_9b]|nr:MAG: hypothetical protein A2041_06135 [Bacteroidetes bacterium GWA2_31_9b]
MKKDFYSLFNIEEKEKSSVLIFLFQSVFLGIFYGAFDVGAHALFLNVYPASMIPKAYVISGIVGIILTTIYARLQSRYSFSRLAIFNLLFISILTVILRVLFQITESPWIVFLVFIMMGPLNIMALLGFWGTIGRMFTLRQGKRLFGVIDTGQIFGAILSTFAIPVLITFGFEQKNLLLLSSVSVFFAFVIQIIISFKYNLNQEIQKDVKKIKNRLPELLKDKYVLHMAIFIVMSMLSAFFIQYSFLSVTKDNYPDPDNLTEFLGAFTGSLLLFTFLFKTFVYSKLMKTYGLKVSILISSFLLGIFSIVAVLIGTFLGYSSTASGFIFFFLIIALSRLFSKALKDAVEAPSFKILYQSLKAEIRYDVQAYVDGTINEIAALSAGLMLAFLGLFEFFKLIHFSYSLIIILIIWFIVSRKLYSEYKLSLQKSLAEYKGKKHDESELVFVVDKSLDSDSVTDQQVLSSMNVFFELHPFKYEHRLEQLAINNKGKIGENALTKILDYKFIGSAFNIKDKIKINPESSNNERFNLLIEKFGKKIDKSPEPSQVIQYTKSKISEEKIVAAYLIGKYYNESYYIYLKALLRDLDKEVKIAAIKAITLNKQVDFCQLIIEYLEINGLYQYANDSLVTIGEGALPYLDQAFYKTGTTECVLKRIVKIIGEIGGNQAIKILVKKLDHPKKEILKQVLIALKNCNFKTDEQSISIIHQIIEVQIGVIGWNISALNTLREANKFGFLNDALQEEQKENYDTLFLLLSLAYDPKSIMHVKENIESGTTEGISYALELLDLFIYDEIKPKLFPIVEDISISEKIQELQNFYPIERFNISDLLISIINRDINNISVWTKACALYAFSEIVDSQVPDDVVAHLFNSNNILRQTAAYTISIINRSHFDSISYRIQNKYLEEFENIFNYADFDRNNLLIEKIFYLKSVSYLKNIKGVILIELAENLFTLNFDNPKEEIFEVPEINNKILFTRYGQLTIKSNNSEISLSGNEIFDFRDFPDKLLTNITLIKDEHTLIYYINRNDLFINMFDYQEIEISILNWINDKYKIETPKEN